MTVVVVDASGVPLAEAVRGDVLIPKVIANLLEMLLHCVCADGKQEVLIVNAVGDCVLPQKVIDFIRYSERALLPGLLFRHVQPPAFTISHDVCHAETEDVSNPHAQVGLCGQDGCHPWVGAAVTETTQKDIHPRQGEIAQVEWVPLDEAERSLTHENDKTVLRAALKKLRADGVPVNA